MYASFILWPGRGWSGTRVERGTQGFRGRLRTCKIIMVEFQLAQGSDVTKRTEEKSQPPTT